MNALQLASFFADRLSLARTLSEDETDALEMMIALESAPVCRRAWTARDDARLLTMKAEGLLAPAIAIELGRTPWAIRNRVNILKGRKIDAA